MLIGTIFGTWMLWLRLPATIRNSCVHAFKTIDLIDPAAEEEGIRWWFDLTGRGGEGMVVKPFDFVARGKRGLVQPAVKCRGREYLRIIYGPEYTRREFDSTSITWTRSKTVTCLA